MSASPVPASYDTQFLGDILTTALEGGIGYWARAYEIERAPDLTVTRVLLVEFESAAEQLDLDIFYSYEALDTAMEEGQVDSQLIHELRAEDLSQAIDRILSGKARLASRLRGYIAQGVAEQDAGEIDSDAADVIVQVAALGEIVYG